MSVANPVVDLWDGPNRRIYIKQGVDAFHWIDDIYIEYRQARRLETDDIRKYNPFMIASGNEPKGGGKATPRLLKLLEGVKVIAWNENIEIYVTGEAITDNADIDPTLFDNSTRTQPLIINYQPPAAEVIVVDAIANALAYNGVLTVNAIEGIAGAEYPVGTSAQPVNNQSDGKTIADKYSLKIIDVETNFLLSAPVANYTIRGTQPNVSVVSGGFAVSECRLLDLIVSGDVVNSHVDLDRCEVSQVFNVTGVWRDCIFDGTIGLESDINKTLQAINCSSGIPGELTPTMDMGGDGANLSLRNYNGGIKLANKTGLAKVSLDLGSGQIILASTVTAGKIVARGHGKLIDENGTEIPTGTWNGVTIINELNILTTSTKAEISDAVWSKTLP